jgi:low affinity Fe/Cu permease
MSDVFRKVAHKTAVGVGSPAAFTIAISIILVWGVTGPIFHFSDTWQLVINTGTTIVTFLMVFLIQNTQNRDALAIQLKLDELIRSIRGARNDLLDLEELSDEELHALKEHFHRMGVDASVIHRVDALKHERHRRRRHPSDLGPKP